MKALIISLLVPGLLVSSASAQDKPDLTDPNRKYNYAFGLDIISTFKQQDIEIDSQAFIAGMKDAMAGKPALTPEQQKAALKELNDEFMVKADAQWKAAAVKNLKEGQDFLAANARKEGIKIKPVIAPDGSRAELQYRIVRSGNPGPSPKRTDTVEVHYVGTLTDGTVFDSTARRGVPATFGMNQVVPGWAEALQMMKVGDKWQLFIPAALGYGQAAPAQIGPNRAMVFELELLSFFTPKQESVAPGTNASPAKAK